MLRLSHDLPRPQQIGGRTGTLTQGSWFQSETQPLCLSSLLNLP